MQKRILITGATGLVGRALVDELVKKRGYLINALTRNQHLENTSDIQYYEWDVERGEIDAMCIDGVVGIIHLAGESIAALPWSNRRKKAILESRVASIKLVYDVLRHTKHHGVKAVISASATGYYSHRGDELMTEDKAPKDDFLGRTCFAWETAVAQGKTIGLRVVSLRSGVILSPKGGIYGNMAKIVSSGLGTVLGSGKQWMPWIHIDDAVLAYTFALEHSGMYGAYNMVAPEQVTLETFIAKLAKQRGKSIWLPNVPEFLLRTVLGQMSELMLSSTLASSEKIENTGFEFKYPTLNSALKQLATKV